MRNWIIIALSVLCMLPSYAAKRTVHTIGDSTMSDYQPAATPKRGWGMYLQAFFNADSVEVNNRGKSGASTRTFYETENLWQSVRQQMHPGDYLIIQFAHNDEKCKGEDVYIMNARLRAEGKDTLTDMRGTEPNSTYKDYLRRFVREARELGVKPVLMSPICRAYFKDGQITGEGRHRLESAGNDVRQAPDKDYVRCMREVSEELDVPFLDMTAHSRNLYEKAGQNYCMKTFFNCGDKTHTGAEGGLAVARLAYELIRASEDLAEMHPRLISPSEDSLAAYARRIEDKGRQAAFDADGTTFTEVLDIQRMENMHPFRSGCNPPSRCGYVPSGGAWPAGEIDEVANRFVEYTIQADKKKGLVVESVTMTVRACGGDGMNIHINYGFGELFTGVTTVYENTALPRNRKVKIHLTQPVLVPAGQKMHIRILPWYDSNGQPQTGKSICLGPVTVKGKKLK